MADSLPVAEGGRPGGGGGGLSSHWLAIGAIAGVGTLMILLLKNQGTSGTTAAGTSINAALGSIQEQQLNTMGLISQASTEELTAMSGMQDSLTKQITDVDGHISTLGASLTSELDQINSGVIANGQSVTQAQNTLAGMMGQLSNQARYLFAWNWNNSQLMHGIYSGLVYYNPTTGNLITGLTADPVSGIISDAKGTKYWNMFTNQDLFLGVMGTAPPATPTASTGVTVTSGALTG